MGGSAGIIGSAVRAGGGFGSKSSGRGQSGYGEAPGYTPVGQAPARTEAPAQNTQPAQQVTQYMPGTSQFNGFGSPFMGGGFGGKSSGLGQFGLFGNPYVGFNPYPQQPMQQPMMQQPMQQPMGSTFEATPEQLRPRPTNMTGFSNMPSSPMFSQQPMAGLGLLAALMSGRFYAEGGEIKDEDEE